MDRIVNVAFLTTDLERVRAINLNSFYPVGNTNTLTVEYNSRIEYSKNPCTGQIDKTEIVVKISKEFPDFEMAQLYQIELQGC